MFRAARPTLHCDAAGNILCLGTSQDLYAGQAVDRLGVRLGFVFPAGAKVSELAAACPEDIKPRVSVKGMNCSLSGLQNQYEQLLQQGCAPEYVCKYCLLCVAETLRRMAAAALGLHPGLPVVFAGGVMSSGLIRDYITRRMPARSLYPVNLPATTRSAFRCWPPGRWAHGRIHPHQHAERTGAPGA